MEGKFETKVFQHTLGSYFSLCSYYSSDTHCHTNSVLYYLFSP
ncbi:unnamed protein product [Prunus brigantina]